MGKGINKMKKICYFYIIRLDNKVINFIPLNDEGYDRLEIQLESQYLTDDDIQKCFSNMGYGYIQNKIKDTRKYGQLYYYDEVRHFCFELSRYKTSIETREIEIN